MNRTETVRAWLQFPMGGEAGDLLAVTNAFVEAIGGEAGVVVTHSEPPLGTTFEITADATNPSAADDERDGLAAFVGATCDAVMRAFPDALITWEAVSPDA